MRYGFLIALMLSISVNIFGIRVSGHIAHDATWGPENNPYVVTGFLYVDAGATLTIQPGVNIYVYGADINILNNFLWSGTNQPLGKMIVVYGKIITRGTALQPITFNRFGDDPDVRWGGIYMHTTAQICTFEHCEFRNSYYCHYVPGGESFSALQFENGRINVRSCLFDMNMTAMNTAHLNSDILVYDCKFYSVNNFLPPIWAGPEFMMFSANHNQVPADYYQVTIAKCYFTGEADMGPVGYYMEILDLFNIYDNYIPRTGINRRLEDYGSISSYGNVSINGKSGAGCYSATVTDTVFCRRNIIYDTDNNFWSSPIGASGKGTNFVSDNYQYGNVQFHVEQADYSHTYFSNNLLETTTQYWALYLNGSGSDVGGLQIFNNVFRNIDPDSTHYKVMMKVWQVPGPKIYNNTFINYDTIMDNTESAILFSNNIFQGFSHYATHRPTEGYLPSLWNNCFNFSLSGTEGFIDGGGNIVADPLFADSVNANFQLQTGSPCIDTGVNITDLPASDIRYYKRAMTSTEIGPGSVDMGAYENNSVYIGGIQGYVYNIESGLPIDCVKIQIRGKLPEFSDTLGVFPYKTGAGAFTVKASRWDYDDIIIPNVVVNEGDDTVLNIPMHAIVVGNEDHCSAEASHTTLTNYPNPFNPSTVISCNLKDADTVRLNIYNIRGQLVKTLINERMNAGTHTVVWNGCDDSGQACASGVYFSRLTAGKTSLTRKMVLVK